MKTDFTIPVTNVGALDLTRQRKEDQQRAVRAGHSGAPLLPLESCVRLYRSQPETVALQVRGTCAMNHGRGAQHDYVMTASMTREELLTLRAAIDSQLRSFS